MQPKFGGHIPSEPPKIAEAFQASKTALAVESLFWRKCIDRIVLNVPAWLLPPLILIATAIFFLYAAPARRVVLRHLGAVLPGSNPVANWWRAFLTFHNFAWVLTDSAAHRLLNRRFTYELEGEAFLAELAAAKGAIVLTAHMGNYDLGAALFAEKFHRHLHMVRAPEPDKSTAEHVDLALRQSSAGAVKIGYSTDGAALAFELLHAVRSGEIVSIQGDRVAGEIGRAPATLFGRPVQLPTGPFVLSLAAERPIYPLFIVRVRYRHYKIIAARPIACARADGPRDAQIAEAMQTWAEILERQVRRYWSHWFAFAPLF